MIKRFGMFAAGVLFGTAGLKILGSKDARKVYAHTTAAVLRAKDSVMKTINAVQAVPRRKQRQSLRTLLTSRLPLGKKPLR